MFITAKRVYGTPLTTSDDKRADIRDLLFDDRNWHVRYLVVGLRHLFRRREVLLKPEQIVRATGPAETLQTALSMKELRDAPSLLSDPPVAKQEELKSARMICWEAYWTGLFDQFLDVGDPHLRSTRIVSEHRVVGVDGEVGFVDNFVIDDQEWTIRYLVLRLGSRQGKQRVIIDPRLVDAISWQQHSVWVRLPRESIQQCEAFVMDS